MLIPNTNKNENSIDHLVNDNVSIKQEKRRKPYTPSFNRTPANCIDPKVGAST